MPIHALLRNLFQTIHFGNSMINESLPSIQSHTTNCTLTTSIGSIPAAFSPMSAAPQMTFVQRWHHRSNPLHSAETAEPSATQKCQFSGSLPCSRLSFRRKICKICTKIAFCESNPLHDVSVTFSRSKKHDTAPVWHAGPAGST